MKNTYQHPPRLMGYDYTLPGAYFITLVTHFRQCLFGAIEQDQVHLEQIGQIAEQEWLRLPVHFPWIELPAYVIMPNHVHGILQINERKPVAEINQQIEQFGRPVPGSLATIIRTYKAAVTHRVRRLRLYRQQDVWQSNYYEHIIRSDQEMESIYAYIVGNPVAWAEDEENPAKE